MASQRVVLITGANQGIGLELVSQLVKSGSIVYLGSRDEKRGREAVERLDNKNVHLIQIDVTNDKSVEKAVSKIESEQGRLDVLVNNAGVNLEQSPEDQHPQTTKVDTVKQTFETNLFGVIKVTTAFIPLLKKSKNPIISNISTGLASVSGQADLTNPWSSYRLVGYNSSKAALNMYTVTLAGDFKEARVNVISPGYVITNMNNGLGQITTEESARGIIKHSIDIDQSGPTMKFLDYSGADIWKW